MGLATSHATSGGGGGGGAGSSGSDLEDKEGQLLFALEDGGGGRRDELGYPMRTMMKGGGGITVTKTVDVVNGR